MLTSFETTEISVSNRTEEVYTNFMKHRLFTKNKYETGECGKLTVKVGA